MRNDEGQLLPQGNWVKGQPQSLPKFGVHLVIASVLLSAQHSHAPKLSRATSDSPGHDLSATSRFTLIPEMGVQTISTGLFGPMPQEWLN